MKYIIAVLILLAAIPSWASTTVLGDGEYATVSAAYSASSPGDTLVIPSGSWVWSSQLVITKGLTIQGAGRTLTTITSNYDASDPTNTFAPGNFLIVYQPDETERAADNLIRITGITLDLNNKCGGIGLFNVTTTPTTKLRIDNCTIKNATNPSGSMRGIMLRGHIWGVIDSNVFQENYKSIDSYG
ncbi:MAG TPA: hypothetical protein DDX29_12080, partial [Clostridiales bacterium]|nr:hypothetical protein [Clostridiales bacterium]